jgi:hypothetical protein
MSKRSSHDPFGNSKYKLWPNKGPRVKLVIWLPTIKSREFPWFTCVQVARHILLESPRWGLQLFLKPHLNQRFVKEVINLQNCKSLNFGNFEIPMRQNDIWVQALWLGIENTIRGKLVTSPKFGSWWVLWIYVCPWFVHAPKVLQLCTNQFVVLFV